jgi:branched-chain amino acid transport system permease protein
VVLTLYAGVWFPVALLLAGVGTGLIGFLVGIPVLRLRGLLLALMTFAFGQVVEVFFLNFTPTGAAEGIKGIFPYTDLWYVFGFLALVVIFLARLRHSRMGRAFEAVKLDETAAEAMGVNVTHAKLIAFATGALSLGLAVVCTPTTPCSSSMITSTEARRRYCHVYGAGRHGRVLWSTVGRLIITYLSTAPVPGRLALGNWGIIVILVMIFRPQGILGRDTLNVRRWFGAREATAA